MWQSYFDKLHSPMRVMCKCGLTVYYADTQQKTISVRPLTCRSNTTQIGYLLISVYHQTHFYGRFPTFSP